MVVFLAADLDGKKPINIPATPSNTYKTHWISSADWLGNGKDRVYLSFEDGDGDLGLDNSFTDKPFQEGNYFVDSNGDLITYKDLSIRSLKCKNSEFDDNPEITAYIQVKDLTDENNNEVFVFNGWMFSSSPSITPFDHPVYDVWLIKCY